MKQIKGYVCHAIINKGVGIFKRQEKKELFYDLEYNKKLRDEYCSKTSPLDSRFSLLDPYPHSKNEMKNADIKEFLYFKLHRKYGNKLGQCFFIEATEMVKNEETS